MFSKTSDLERGGDQDETEDEIVSPSSSRDGRDDKHDHETDEDDHAPPLRLAWRDRIKHFTWTWFTMTMATGGLANVLHTIPLRFHGLYAIGCIFFIFNIVLFIFNCVMISLRFKFHPQTFKASFLHPTESLFTPAPIISICIILINIIEYGIDHYRVGGIWLIHTMQVLFWVYVAVAFAYAVGIYLLIWTTQVHTIAQMTPVWIFPIYPLLLVGPLANALTRPPYGISGDPAVQIIAGAIVVQGAGFMVSLMMYSAFLYRLMSQKFPVESSRPALFVSVGPSGFTISGVINMAQNLAPNLPANFMGDGELAGQVIKIVANCFGLWLWGLAIFFFMTSVGSHYSTFSQGKKGRIKFASTFWSFVFPNSALCTGTFAVARALDRNRPIQIVGCVMAGLLVVVWLFIFCLMIRAVIIKDVLWPETSEDKQADLFHSRNPGAHSSHHGLRSPLGFKKAFILHAPPGGRWKGSAGNSVAERAKGKLRKRITGSTSRSGSGSRRGDGSKERPERC